MIVLFLFDCVYKRLTIVILFYSYDAFTCLNYDRAALLVYAYTFDHSYFVLLVRRYLLKYDSSTCLNYDRVALLVYAYHV